DLKLMFNFFQKYPTETTHRYLGALTLLGLVIALLIHILLPMEKLTWDGLLTALSATLIPIFVLFFTLGQQKAQQKREDKKRKDVLSRIMHLNIVKLLDSIIWFRGYVHSNTQKISLDS